MAVQDGNKVTEDGVQVIRDRMKQILESCQKSIPLKEKQPDREIQGSNQKSESNVIPWMLEEWRRISIPDWRRILKESINSGDKKRAEYARWILKEVLDDPEYREQNHD
jgi:hypothetical protein